MKQVKYQSAPALRFHPQIGEEYPAWRVSSFGAEFDFLSHNSLSRDALDFEHDIKCVHYGDVLIKYGDVLSLCDDIPTVADDEYLEKINKIIEKTPEVKSQYYLQSGDVVIADTAEDYTVAKAVELDDVGLCLAGLHTMACRAKSTFAEHFLGHYLNSEHFHFPLMRLMVGTKVISLGKKELSQSVVRIPCLEEQQQIATLFTVLDRRIDLANKKLATLQIIKQGMLEKIFSQELRFKDDEGKEFPVWKEHIIEEFYKNISSGKSSKSDTGSYPLYGSMGIIGHSDTTDYIGDKILIARVGAHAGDLNFVHQDCGVTDNTLIIQDSNENIDLKWLYYCLVAVNLNKLTFGTGQPLITGKMLKKLQIEVPDKTEQQKIAAYFTALDRAIAAAQQKAAALRTIKRGLLQKMFV